jgi:hypothetical protein
MVTEVCEMKFPAAIFAFVPATHHNASQSSRKGSVGLQIFARKRVVLSAICGRFLLQK